MLSPVFDLLLDATIIRGHGVASGSARDCPHPGGTIRAQIPFFKQLGLDLSAYYPGTLNLDIAPRTFRVEHADYCFPLLRWTDRIAPETFSMSRCRLVVRGNSYDALIYYPHPETKTEHFQASSMIEVLAPRIEGVVYGDAVRIAAQSRQVIVV
jgi:hypothetical protein